MQELAIEYYIRNFFALSENDKDNALLALSKISEQVLAVMTAVFGQMVKSSSTNNTEADKLQRCMIQYMACKHLTIHNIITSTTSISINGEKSAINDFTSAISILRSMYELLLVHHTFFVSSNTDEERNFLINIWKYKGLKFLAEDIVTDLPVVHTAKDERSKFLLELQKSPLYNEKAVNKAFRSGIAHFKGDPNNRVLKSCSLSQGWELLKETEEFKTSFTQSLYSRFCAETHPSYYALIMFESQDTIKPNPRLVSLYLSCALFCLMIVETIFQKEELKATIKSLDELQQNVFWTFLDVL